jgi:hypothetical protein
MRIPDRAASIAAMFSKLLLLMCVFPSAFMIAGMEIMTSIQQLVRIYAPASAAFYAAGRSSSS